MLIGILIAGRQRAIHTSLALAVSLQWALLVAERDTRLACGELRMRGLIASRVLLSG